MIAHEYANLFPMMLEADLVRLAEDIKEKGQSDPVITLDGKILDGRNRFKACELNGITPRCEEYAGDDPLGFVISHNLHRRHLTEPQRAMVANNLAGLTKGRPSDDDNTGIPVITQPEAAAMLNVSKDSVQQARKIAKQGSPELNEAVMQGGVSLAAAVDVSSLPHDEQAAVVAKGADAVKSKAKEIRQQASEPAEESEPLVVDGVSEPESKQERNKKWIPDDARRLWLLAKTDLDKILKEDKSRETVLLEVIKYAQQRIDKNK